MKAQLGPRKESKEERALRLHYLELAKARLLLAQERVLRLEKEVESFKTYTPPE